jgi:hypothetical protein
MLLKYDEHLYSSVKVKRNIVNQNIFYQHCRLNIFEQITSTNELSKKLVHKELLIFKWYQMDVKNIKGPFQ